jgi:hypothetical protein
MGDVNRDGLVTPADVAGFIDLALGRSNDPLQRAQADFDGNGAVDADDLPAMVHSLSLPN